MGVLVGKDGFYGNGFRIAPPLCFTKEYASRSFIPILFTVQCECIMCFFGFRLPCRCNGLLNDEEVEPPM